MSRFWEILRRTPPIVAPADPGEPPGRTFGFTSLSEPDGWTVTAYGADGRRLGRPLKGLSEAAQTTLTRPATETADVSKLRRLAEAWTDACKHSSTNADVLTAFADAAMRMGEGEGTRSDSLEPLMREDIRRALTIDADTSMQERTIDITTTGRRSGEPRRVETCFYRFEDSIYLSGLPAPRPRAWLLNLAADPSLTFHLKHGVVADLPARATVIADPAERRRILGDFVEDFNRRHGLGSSWPEAVLEDWIAGSPLAQLRFDEPV